MDAGGGGDSSRECTGLSSKLESGTEVERRARETRSSEKWTKHVADVRRRSPEKDADETRAQRTETWMNGNTWGNEASQLSTTEPTRKGERGMEGERIKAKFCFVKPEGGVRRKQGLWSREDPFLIAEIPKVHPCAQGSPRVRGGILFGA